MVKRKPGGGRKPLSNEPTVKIEIVLPQSQKVALFAYAQMRSAQEQREVTVSELIRKATTCIISGISEADDAEMEASHLAIAQMVIEEDAKETMTYKIKYYAIDGSDGGTIRSGFTTIDGAKEWAKYNLDLDEFTEKEETVTIYTEDGDFYGHAVEDLN